MTSASPHVVVIGAGIVGSAIAFRLAQRGSEITLVDASEPGGGTSRTSFAWLNAQAKIPREYYELNVSGMHAYRGLAAELGGTWYRPYGSLEWAQSDSGHASLDKRAAKLRDWGYPVRTISLDEARLLEPQLRIPSRTRQLVYFPGEGHVLTGQLVDRLIKGATTLGAKVVSHDPVIGFETVGARLAAARLQSGRCLRSDTMVFCAGWRTAGLAASVGVDVPLVSPAGPGSAALGVVATTVPGPIRVQRVVESPEINLRPAAGGRLVLAAADVDRWVGVDPAAPELAEAAAELLRRACRIVPSLTGSRPDQVSTCIRALPIDGHPIVGWAPSVPGAYVVVTHSGITLAPYLASLVAEDVQGCEANRKLAPYRLDRFAKDTRSADGCVQEGA